MTCTLEIAYKLLGRSQSPLKYILTYKMSQDHLELFFGCICSRGGSNNNPNCSQFKKTLRQLLLFTKNKTVESGNCSNFVAPGGDALDFRSEKRCIIKSDDNLDETEIDNYLDILSSIQLIEYTNEILDYIAGYIVKHLCKKVLCPYYIDLLVKSDLTDHSYVKDANFTSFVNWVKLKIFSSLIIQELEKIFSSCCCYK